MTIEEILQKVKNRELSIEEAKNQVENPDMDYACIDYNREKRTGVPEVIYCEGKSAKQIKNIVKNMLMHGSKHILGTRCDREKYEEAAKICDKIKYYENSRIMMLDEEPFLKNKGKIAVVCAGTSDIPVAEEAALTARYLGNHVVQISDVGVAGIHRLFHRIDEIRMANVVVVVAGMEGALASVVGGLTDKPVIAVPTSVGYGANFNGLSALLAMLNSCASGVSVVNIDNGFGAGYMAHSINCLGGKEEK
ncbi:MAG: nickel pincer cofactor biosynthesis protein LarB [Lachnospiraceae bacterium]